MRQSNPPVSYLVGTPKGRLGALENGLLETPWHAAPPSVKVKLLPRDGETYVLVQSEERIKAHIFISFLSCCLQVTLKVRLKRRASGLTPRAAIEKFAAVQIPRRPLPDH